MQDMHNEKISSRRPDQAIRQPFSPMNKGLIKGKKGSTRKACRQMHGICKVQPPAMKFQNSVQLLRIIDMDVYKAEEFSEGLSNFIGLELVCITQHPLCFQDNRIGNKNLFPGKNLFCFAKLGLIITSEQSDNNIGINADHDQTPWPPGLWPRPFLQLSLPGR